MVEIPRKEAWSYLIRLAHVESTTSIPQTLCENWEEDCRPQPSLQGATPVAHQLTWLVNYGNIAEHRTIIHNTSVHVSISAFLGREARIDEDALHYHLQPRQ